MVLHACRRFSGLLDPLRLFVATSTALLLAAPPAARADDFETPISCERSLIRVHAADPGLTLRVIGLLDAGTKRWLFNDEAATGRLTLSVPPGVYLARLRTKRSGTMSAHYVDMPVHAPAGVAILLSASIVNATIVDRYQQRDSLAERQFARPLDELPTDDLPSSVLPAQPLKCARPLVVSKTAQPWVDPESPRRPILASTAPDAARVRFIDRHATDVLYLNDQDDCNASQVAAMPAGTPEIARKANGVPDSEHGMLAPVAGESGGMTELSFAADQVVNVSAAPLCSGGIRFQARASTQYEVSVTPTSAGNRCIYAVDRLEAADGQVRRVPETVGGLACRPPRAH